MVGRDTLVTAVTVLPASSVVPVFAYSGPGMAIMSGGVPGHSGICTCPAAGCHTSAFACRLAHASNNVSDTIHGFMALPRPGARPRLHDQDGKSGGTPRHHPALCAGLAAVATVFFFGQAIRLFPTQPARRVHREVGEDGIRACALERGERL